MKKVLLTAIIVISFLVIFYNAEAQQERTFTPKKVQVDTNYDGKIDRIEFYDIKGQIEKVESDINSDGKTDEWVYYKNGNPVRSEKDTNSDGKPDVWLDY